MKNNDFEYLTVDIPIKSVNGSTYIDTDFLLHVIDFMNDLDKKGQENTETNQTIAKEFAQKVRTIWGDCLAPGPKPWKNSYNVIGEALMVDYTFDPDKLMAHSKEIYALISMVHLATTYEEMKYLDTGEKWSELRQPVSFLMALGNALKLIYFKNDRTTWSKEESRNPELKFTLK